MAVLLQTSPTGGAFQAAAALIARRGWCQGMAYIGPPDSPQAAGLMAAVRWACTGNAETDSATTLRLMAELRGRLDPHRTAAFSDADLLAAWNDVPSRSREDVMDLLARIEPVPPLSVLAGIPLQAEAASRVPLIGARL